VSLHECIQLTFLLLLVCGRQTSLLLSLIVHHFLNNATCVTIEIRKFRVLWLDLLCVDLFVSRNDRVPPVLLILLGELDFQHALA
jgi:hypothetical protein